MTGPRVVVAFSALAGVVDRADLAERFAEVEVVEAAYDLPAELRAARDVDSGATGLAEREPAPSPELVEALARAEVLLTLDAPRRLMDLAPGLRWIQSVGSGTGHLAACAIDRRRVVLTNAAGVGAAPIAEWVLGRILAIYKRFDRHAAQQRDHRWQPAFGEVVAGRRVLVVGLGAIGQAVASRCGALDMEVVGIRRSTGGPPPRGVREVRPPEDLLDLAASADVVVAALPSTPETQDLFDERFFAAMAPRSVFVNVGRGSAVVEEALAAALTNRHLRGAAIDVARVEPLPASSPLWDVEGLAISPHSSVAPDRYLVGVWDLFLDNLDAWRTGRPLRNVVDPTG